VRIVSIVGARPEFVQVGVLSGVLRRNHTEILIHTGQHYDDRMSERFFEQLELPEPDVNLAVGSLAASAQTAEMLAGLANAIAAAAPDLVIVRGDTNSTLAGGIAAKQLLLPLAHIEAGMRSYDRTMPEEINRLVTDHICDVALVTDASAAARLAHEGIESGVYVCGDVMYDIFKRAEPHAAGALSEHLRDLVREPYDLLTLHRSENTDDRTRLAAIIGGFEDPPRPVIFPLHPRTASRLRDYDIALPAAVVALEPLDYLSMVALECAARTIFTDSGGVQREAYFAAVPCVTLRDSTEWTNTVEAGWNRLVGARSEAIRAALRSAPTRPATRPALFGDGDAAEKILAALESEATREVVTRARATRAARGQAAASAG
jgi:UDP-GlcNAc3NAcA epimerase